MSFEITIDGQSHPGIFATEAEANNAANSFRQQNPGKVIGTRVKQDGPTQFAQDGLGTALGGVDPAKVLVQKDGMIFEQGAEATAEIHRGVPAPLDRPSTLQAEAEKPAVEAETPRHTTNVPPPFKR